MGGVLEAHRGNCGSKAHDWEEEAITRKAHNVDREATEARHFADPASYVTHDGHEFLFGADVRERRQEVYDRAGGNCEGCRKRTSWSYGHMHHVKHRGLGGSDDLENLLWICSECHRKEHVSVRWKERR